MDRYSFLQYDWDTKSVEPLYIQLCNRLIEAIQAGNIQVGSKMPGIRQLAPHAKLNRHTIMRAYEEMEALGWVDVIPKRGTYVKEELPLQRLKEWDQPDTNTINQFQYYYPEDLKLPLETNRIIGFDDGCPDVRLAPLKPLGHAYSRKLYELMQSRGLYYNNGLGHFGLRQSIARDLNESRGLHVSAENIIITRGSQMAIRLAAESLLKRGDQVVVAERGYKTANLTFQHIGAKLQNIPIDEEGIIPEALEKLCKNYAIRALYLTPHHHHPTTVVLPVERRKRVLELAQKYGFGIIEDDYDYSFHYENRPIMPLASKDNAGQVLYCGSFTKLLAPAFRIGYLVGPKLLIKNLPKIRRLMDRQGDTVLEAAMAELLDKRIIHRQLKKAKRIYHNRLDYFSEELKNHFQNYIDFEKPVGGLAIWLRFEQAKKLKAVATYLKSRQVYLNDGKFYALPGEEMQHTRAGFASIDKIEMARALQMLEQACRNTK